MKIQELTTQPTTFRKMTQKSTVDFGKYKGMSVYSIICQDKTYIGWIYFNMPNIDFFDDVLDLALVPQELRYDKRNSPISTEEAQKRFRTYSNNDFDKKIEVAKKVVESQGKNVDEEKRLVVAIAKNMKRKKINEKVYQRLIPTCNSIYAKSKKNVLQSKNQGH